MFESDFLKLKKRNLSIWVIVILLVVLLLPTLSRFYSGNSSFVGKESYYHYNVANALSRENSRDDFKWGSWNIFSPSSDVVDSVYLDRNFVFTPFHYLLVWASYLISLAGAVRIVPLLLGLLSVFVFNLILKNFIDMDYKRYIVLIFLIINPAFIYIFTVATPHSAAIFLTLSGFYFFMRKEKWSLAISISCFVLSSLFGLFNALISILLLLCYVLYTRKWYFKFLLISVALLFSSVITRVSFFYTYTYTPKIDIIGNLFSDLGGLVGFGLFIVVLAFYGVFSNWKKKSEFFQFFLFGILIFGALFLIGNVANIYLSFFVAFAAAAGFLKLYESDWAVKDLRSLTLLILICGLLFSSASYLNRLTTMGPHEDEIDALVWLGSNTFKDGFVLSQYDNGYLISSVARNPVLTDAFSSSDYDQSFLYKIQESAFYSRDIIETRKLFDAYNINYVFIDKEMKEGLVWSRADEGLLFMLTNKETFKKVYDENNIEIWEFVYASEEDVASYGYILPEV